MAKVACGRIEEIDATAIDAAILRLHILDLQTRILGIIADAEEQTLPQIASYGRMWRQFYIAAARVQTGRERVRERERETEAERDRYRGIS